MVGREFGGKQVYLCKIHVEIFLFSFLEFLFLYSGGNSEQNTNLRVNSK